MRALGTLGGLLILFMILWDAFETVILPRRVTRRIRLALAFYRSTCRSHRPLAASGVDPACEQLR